MDHEMIDEAGSRVTVRSIATIRRLVREGRLTSSTLIKYAGCADFVPASTHETTKNLFVSLLAEPGPVGVEVRAELDRRAAALNAAVAAMKPVVEFLTARKREGGDVSLRLEPPTATGETTVYGQLRCASLGHQQNAAETYSIVISRDGSITLNLPGDESEPDYDGPLWSVTDSADNLASMIKKAEVEAELRSTMSGASFVI